MSNRLFMLLLPAFAIATALAADLPRSKSPAGVAMENTGHHHLLINAELPAPNFPIPTDANHVHFGKGQTKAYSA